MNYLPEHEVREIIYLYERHKNLKVADDAFLP
jgi:hypothetical protein